MQGAGRGIHAHKGPSPPGRRTGGAAGGSGAAGQGQQADDQCGHAGRRRHAVVNGSLRPASSGQGGCGWLMRGGGQRRPRWGRSATGRTNNLLGIQRPPIAHDQDCTRQADAPGGRGGEQSGGGWECVCSLGWRRDAAGCWVCWLCASGKRGSQERQRMNAGSERGEFTKALGRGQAAPARGRWPGRAGGLQDPGLQRPPTSALRSWGHWPKRGEGAHSPIGRHVPHWVSA